MNRFDYKVWRFIASVTVLFSSSIALAESTDRVLETIVVAASRLERPLAQLSQSLQVIDRDEIVARQAPNVAELLRQLAGANVIQQGARGGVTSVVMRGGEPNFTIVLIDGIKVNDSTNTRGGSYDFSYLDINNVERVEVVRGPMSAVYGSDALSGVINIITREQVTGTEVAVEAGGHGLQAGSLTFGSRVGSVDAVLGVHALSEDGDIEGSSYEDAGFDSSLRFDVGDGGEAGASLRYLDADSTSFPEDSGGTEYAVIRDVDRRSVRESHVRVYLDQAIGSKWRASASLSRYDRSEQSASPGIAPGIFDGVPPNAADTDFTRDQLSLSASTSMSSNAAVVVGAEWQRERGDSVGIIDIGFPLPTDFRLARDTISVFTEGEYRVEALTLQASLRRDDPDGINSQTSAQVGAVYRSANGAGALRLNWGEGFKAPSFFALAHPLVGNSDLKSESARSIDLGYRKTFASSASIDVAVFRNEYKDLIDFDPVLFTNVNRSRVVAQGVELTAHFPLSDAIHIDGHLTYSDSDIRDSDATLRGRPKWRGGLVANWQITDQWGFVASLLALDDFYEVSIPTGGLFLEGYERLDLALSYEVSSELRLGFAIDNAFDTEYMEAVGFPAPGVRGRINASYFF